ncbi:MAG: PIG-L family deacetylase [Balneolaceae bacterium]
MSRLSKLCRTVIVTSCLLLLVTWPSFSQALDYEPKILMVTAHPDDDVIFSATAFKTTRLLNGVVDLAIVTNGEGGYRYSTVGNYMYGLELDKEEVGRAYLPGIRKKEVMAGGDIMGLRNYYFFDQVDDSSSLDVNLPMEQWDTDMVRRRLKEIILEEGYDFIFTMLPRAGTHAHHKASALLALQAVNELDPAERPIVLGATFFGQSGGTVNYTLLEGYPLTEIRPDTEPFTFDRSQRFGFDDRLDYNIISNWVIAEHKSQGTMQMYRNGIQVEAYLYYALNADEGIEKARKYFRAVNEAEIYKREE